MSDADADPGTRVQRALERAYRYLGHRERTVAEVRRHLAAKEVDPDAIDGAIEELVAQRYLDDARYAEHFADDRRRLDGWGAERIARKLEAVGVDAEHVEAALAGQDAEDELDAAVELLRRRFRAAPDSPRERERALGLLVRKGYELDLAYDAVRALERG